MGELENRRYWYDLYKKMGLFLIPTRGKFPAISGWQEPNKNLEFSVKAYDIGALCGYQFEVIDVDDNSLVSELDIESPVVKFGKAGRASYFFKPTIGKSFSGHNWDFLSIGRHTALPPTQHPSGVLYSWRNNYFDLEALEPVPISIINYLKQRHPPKPLQRAGLLLETGRHNNIIKVVWRIVIENILNDFECVDAVIKFDKEAHSSPWFYDKQEPHQGKSPENTALKMILNARKKANLKNIVLPKLIGDLEL